MPEPATAPRVVVLGEDAGAVGREVRRRRAAGARCAGFVGVDEGVAREMALEMLGGVDELVTLPGPAAGEGG